MWKESLGEEKNLCSVLKVSKRLSPINTDWKQSVFFVFQKNDDMYNDIFNNQLDLELCCV